MILAIAPDDFTIVIYLVEEGSDLFHLSPKHHTVPSNLLDGQQTSIHDWI